MPGRPRNINEHMAQRMERLGLGGGHLPDANTRQVINEQVARRERDLASVRPNDNVQQINIAELRAQNPDLDAAMNEHARRNPPAPRPAFSEQQTRQMPRPSPPPFDPETRDTSNDVRQINIAELRAQNPELDAAMKAVSGVPETSGGVKVDDLAKQGVEPTPIRRLDSPGRNGPSGPSLG